ncbi:MAG: ABC transporter ATP-binding protein [Desulforudis sp.]|jgi:peptide/nickel transport system ATP-binding protein|nr:MAG: ABC transporter ATP-binding protein [Desulforudis sp.]
MLSIQDLTVSYGEEIILGGVSLEVAAGETVAVIGESGAGKTTLGKAVAGLVDGNVEGFVSWDRVNLLTLTEEQRRSLRWNEISIVFQRGGQVLHPGIPVEVQVAEPLFEHGLCTRFEALQRARRQLLEVKLPAEKLGSFPHLLSGGEVQRALIAMALVNGPRLVILDEPTAGLDALTRQSILNLLRGMSGRCAFLMLTHDLAAAAGLARRVAVLYGGQVLETGPSDAVLRQPKHPYTRGLLRAYPNMTTTKDLQGIPGRAYVHTHPHTHHSRNGQNSHVTSVYDSHDHPHSHDTGAYEHLHGGCPFHGRCTQAVPACLDTRVHLARVDDGHSVACHRGGVVSLVHLKGVTKNFGPARVLEDVSLQLNEGETLALVGESGSGKTTLARVIMGLTGLDSGSIYLEEQEVVQRNKDFYRRVQMVFQDPLDSISHRYNVLQAVAEPLILQQGGKPGDYLESIRMALEEVQLPGDDGFLLKYPHHLSGGEAQRVAIARALVLSPKLLVADEPTSSLDPSVQAKVLRLLFSIQDERGLGILLITHDLALARKVSDRIAVLRDGRVVEVGPSDRITGCPVHPYTRELVSAAPRLSWSRVRPPL